MRISFPLLCGAILLLVLISDAFSTSKQHRRFKHQHREYAKHNKGKQHKEHKRSAEQLPSGPKFYQPGYEYQFRYDSQVASGYAPWVSMQRAASRFQALVTCELIGPGEGQMRLSECLAGQLNGEPPLRKGTWDNPAQLQPIDLFESGTRFAHEQLERPMRFTFSPKGISAVFFESTEPAWSRNIKKSVISMMQYQISEEGVDPRENALEEALRAQTGTIGGKPQPDQDKREQSQWGHWTRMQQRMHKSFTVAETSIEGDCETLYSVMPVEEGVLNVTKSVNFARCARLADIAYGMQMDEEAKQRGAEDTEQYPDQRQQDRMTEQLKNGNNEDAGTKWTNRSASPMIARQVLDRSTTVRYVLFSSEQKQQEKNKINVESFGIRSVELLSQYTLKESESEQSHAMQTVATAKLHFIGAKPKGNGATQSDKSELEQEQLLYNGEMEQQEKCFFMYGDEPETEQCQRRAKTFFTNGGSSAMKLAKGNPFPLNFPDSASKLARAEQCVRQMSQQEPQQQGSLSRVEFADEFVQILRFCSEQELTQLQQQLANDPNAAQMFADALAAAGTRNTLRVLLKRIEQGEFNDLKAAQMMKTFSRGSGFPAPSDRIADIVLALCKTSRVQRSAILKQTCWLSFGAVVGELQQLQRIHSRSPVETPLGQSEQCPEHKMELYTKALVEQYKQEDGMYEKIIALKSIGNAALGEVPEEVAETIAKAEDEAEKSAESEQHSHGAHGMSESDILRQNAIEATRRIPSRKVHRLLTTVFVNQREHPQTRIIALGTLLQSQLPPSAATLDQIAFTMSTEQCPQVLSYTYTVLQAMARSPAKRHQQKAQHIKTALRMAGVDEQELSIKIRTVPGGISQFKQTAELLFGGEEGQREGVLLETTKVFPDRHSGMPAHAIYSLSSLLNGQMAEEKLRMTLCQSNIERMFTGAGLEEMMRTTEEANEKTTDEEKQKQQENQQNGANNSNKESTSYFSSAAAQLRSLWRRLSIRGRSEDQQKDQKPLVVISLRVNNIDTIVWPIGVHQQKSPITTLKHLLTAGIGRAVNYVGGQHQQQQNQGEDGQRKWAIDSSGILFWQERAARVPISTGQQLNIQQKSFLFGNIKANAEQLGNSQTELQLHPQATFGRIQKMKVWSSPVHLSGVKDVIATEANIPLNAQLSVQAQQKQIKLSIRVPQTQIRLFSLHTMPMTFVGETDKQPISSSPSTKLPYGERCRAVHNQQLAGMACTFDKRTDIQQSFAQIPFHVRGYLHTPRRVDQLKEWTKVLLASENHYEVQIEPQSGQTPREITASISWGLFQPHANTPGALFRPQIHQFVQQFSSSEQNDQQQKGDIWEEEDNNLSSSSSSSSSEEEQNGGQRDQKQRIGAYLDKWAAQKAYQHTVKTTLETVGGDKNKRAVFQWDGVCDARAHTCSAHAQMRHSVIGQGEQWAADVQLHAFFPETVADLEQFGEQHMQQFMYQAQLEWAAKGQPKQQIKLNIKGEPSSEMSRLTKQFIQQQQQSSLLLRQQQQQLPLTVAHPFVNKFEAAADWKLKPATQAQFLDILEAMKSEHFFNAQSSIVVLKSDNGQQNQQKQYQQQQQLQTGRTTVRVSIDPVTQKHANITVQTAGQQTVIRQLELLHPFRPFPLVRSASSLGSSIRPSHSVSQFFHQIAQPMRSRAECFMDVDRSQLQSFDGAQMAAPVSKCWTVLAKDCSAEQNSQYAVLIKSMPAYGDQKKIKVITPEMGVLVVEPKPTEAKLQVRINGRQEPITSDTPSSDIPDGIEFAKSASSGTESVIIEAAVASDSSNRAAGSLSVRFDGQTVRIQLNGKQLRQQQCGLCGDWNGNAKDEWRLPEGEQAQSAKEFHRAYSLAGAQEDECKEDDLDTFYAENGKKFEEDEEVKTKKGQKQRKNNNNNNKAEVEEIEPKQQTQVIEYPHKVCFSLRPVTKCPPGTMPAGGDDGQTKKQPTQQKVQFTCVERSSIETKRLKAQVRRGEIVQLTDYPASFQEVLIAHERCIKY